MGRLFLGFGVLVVMLAGWGGLVGSSAAAARATAAPDAVGTVAGTLRNVIGEPLGGIEVSLYRAESGDWAYAAYTYTAGDGSYVLTASPGTYRVLFRDWNGVYAYEYYDDAATIAGGEDVVVSDGATTDVNGTLNLAGRIRGTVTGYQGQPVQYGMVAVFEHGQTSEQVLFIQQLGGPTYDIGGLPTGDYAIRFTGQVGSDYALEWYDSAEFYADADPIPVARGFTTSGIDAVLGEPVTGSINGSVTDEDNAPLAGIEISLWREVGGAWEIAAWQNSAADGSFGFDALNDGTYRLQAVDRGQTYAFEFVPDGLTLDEAADVVVAGAPVSVPTIVMEPAARIQGTLTDPDGLPLEYPLVFVYQAAPERGNALFVAAADSGTYDLGGLRSGDYIVQFTGRQGLDSFAEYYDDASVWDAAAPVAVTNGSVTDAIDAVMGFGSGGTVRGTVADRYGRAFDFAAVEAYAFNGVEWTLIRTEPLEHGETDFAIDLPADTYRLRLVAGSWVFSDQPIVEWYADVDSVTDAVDIAVTAGDDVSGIDAVLGEDATGTISGQVTDSAGAPLADVEVYLFDRTLAPQYDQTTVTDVDGNYTLHGLWPNEYVVEFYDPQLVYTAEYFDDATQPQTATRIPVAGAVTGISAALAPAVTPLPGSISGVVSADGDGAPILGVRVTAETATGGFAVAYTDSSGFYRLRHLAAGDHVVRFDAADGAFVREFFDDAPDEASVTPVTVNDGAVVAGIDAGLAGAGTIRGTVSDIFGNPFPIVFVTAYAWQDGAWVAAPAQFSSDGLDYELSGISAGVYRVGFYGSPYFGDGYSEFYDDVPSIEAGEDVVVTGGEVIEGISAVLGTGPGGAIGGTVFAPEGVPLAGIEVRAIDDWGFVSRETTTAADGTYTLTDVFGGVYYVEFSDPHGNYPGEFFDDAPSLAFATPVVVDDEVVDGIDAVLDGGNGGPGGGAIAGTVTDETSGQPLGGIEVACYAGDGFYFGACVTTTAADGTYLLGGNLPTGVYTVRFSDPAGGYAAEWHADTYYREEATAITVTVGATVSGIDAALTPAGAIAGTVTDANGDAFPLTTAVAFLWDGGDWRFFKSASAAYEEPDYVLDGLPAGTYRVKLRGAFLNGNGYDEFWNDRPTLEAADDVIVVAGATTSGIDAVLGPVQPGGVSGGVTDAAGAPVEGARVSLLDADGGEVDETFTGVDGHYSFGNVSADSYLVRFSDPTGQFLTEFYNDAIVIEDATAVVVGSGVVSGVDAVLARPGGIDGRVLDLQGTPLDFARVTAFSSADGEWEPAAMAFADPAGAYAFAGLVPGSYRIEFVGYRLVDGETPAMFVEYWEDAAELATATDVIVGDGATVTGINAALGNLSPDGVIGGLVLNDRGRPAAGADVTLLWHDGEAWTLLGRTTVDEDGAYRLRTLADGRYTVCFGVGNDGYARRCHGDDSAALPAILELHAGANRQRVDMVVGIER